MAGGEWSWKHLTGRGPASLQRESLYRAAGVVSCVRAGRARWAGDGAGEGWVTCLHACWFAGWVANCLAGWLTGWLAGWIGIVVGG